MGTCTHPLPPRLFFYVPNESALIRICFNRFTESACRSRSFSSRRASFHERRTELFANRTAEYSKYSHYRRGFTAFGPAAASVIGVSKGSIQTRRDGTGAWRIECGEVEREKGEEGERYGTALSRCGIRYRAGRVIRQPGPLVRLRAAKLTRSSVYTLIATPRLRNPLRRHRVTGHRGSAAVLAFCFSRVLAAPAEFTQTKPKSVRHFTSAVEMGFTSGTNGHPRAFPDPFSLSPSFSYTRRAPHTGDVPPVQRGAGKKEESRVRAGFPATDRPVAVASRSDVFIGKGPIVKFEIARAIGTLKLQSRYKLYFMCYKCYTLIKLLHYVLLTVRIN